MTPASEFLVPRHTAWRAEHETCEGSAEQAGERRSEGAICMRQRLLQDDVSDAGPSRDVTTHRFSRHAWARGAIATRNLP